MKKVLALFFTMILVMATGVFPVSCGEKTAPAEDIVSKVAEAMAGVTTYESEMDVRMNADGETNGEKVSIDMTISAKSSTDITNKQAKLVMDMNMNMTGPEEESFDMSAEMYIIGDTTYMLMETPGMEAEWIKSETEAELWGEMNYIGSQIDMLKIVEYEITGSQVINGDDCYVLTLKSSIQKIWDLFAQQMELTGEETDDIPLALLEKIVQSFSAKQWIDKKTYYLNKASIQMNMVMTPEDMGVEDEEGEMAMEYVMNILAYDYNQPVSIILPAEAEDAPWGSGW